MGQTDRHFVQAVHLTGLRESADDTKNPLGYSLAFESRNKTVAIGETKVVCFRIALFQAF